MLQSTNLQIDSPDFEETLEDTEERQLKMINKMIQLDYEKLNALYETFVPKKEPFVEQTYFSIPSTSNVFSESNEAIQKTYAYGDVRSENQDLLMMIFELKDKLKTFEKGKGVNTKFDKYMTSGKLLCVTPLPNNIAVQAKKVSNPEDKTRSKPVTSHSTPKNEQKQKKNANVIARGMYKIPTQESQTQVPKTNMNVSNSTGVGSSNSDRRPKSKDTKSNNRLLKNTNDKSSYAHVRKVTSSVRIYSNKRETMNSTVCQSNTSVLNTKTINAVNDGSNIVCVSCGKDVFMLSYEKCIARYVLSKDSRVKRALFTTPVVAKSKNLEATSVVVKSRLSVAKTSTTTNKVSSVLSLFPDSSQIRTLSNYMKNKIATSQKWCSKHMTGNLQLLRNFIEKFMGIVLFGNDHFIAITGYGDDVQGNLTICHAQILKIRTDNGTDFKHKKLWSFYAKLGIVHNTSISRRPEQNGVVERRNHTLVEAARTMLIFSKTLEFLWAEAIATACFTQNRSIIFCYRINDRDDLGKMKPKANIDLDNLFGPLYEEYYATSIPEVLDNSAANTLDNKDTLSSSSIFIKEDKAPQIVSSPEEPFDTEPNTPVSNENADELVQKDVAELDGNNFYNPLHTSVFEEAESSLTYQDSSNMHESHQTHRSTDK
ncbi:retrovirus-related pol polyprotein from transposon TNT 1-94 [Tanacetum coccineum]|uniref:Retrovirus-related pol polyprotein from transposon TNT 1-94 n=1 Tax=Tanacetum coccineum TaxID=301880 RepID=A0ABQ4WFC2_9ASTR